MLMRIGTMIVAASMMTLVFSSPGLQADETGADHVFECGDDVPPSGTYLDLGLEQVLDYDCQTGLLTTSADAWPLGACKYVNAVPLYGRCLMISDSKDAYGNTIEDRYTAEVLVTMTKGVSASFSVNWWTHVESLEGRDIDCQGAPCYSGIDNVCVQNYAVLYCRDGPVSRGPAITCGDEWLSVTGKVQTKQEISGATSTANEATMTHLCN